MLATKGMRFPIDIILVCIRWYVVYPLSYRHLEEILPIPNKNDNGVASPCRATALSAASRLVLASIGNWNNAGARRVCRPFLDQPLGDPVSALA